MADGIDTLAAKLAALTDQLAAPAAQAAIEAARMEGWSVLSGSFCACVFAGLSILAARKLWEMLDDDDLGFAKIGSGFLWAIAGIAGMFAIWGVLDPRTWTTIVHPEWWIAHKLLGL